MIDDRININNHVKYACKKGSNAIKAIASIMPNNSGSSSSKRRLLASVSSSILRQTKETKQNQRKLSSMFRLMALRVMSAFRLTLAEDSECYRRRQAERVRKAVRAESLA
ncbi:uncharacterized protein LOC135710233 [Ochlerotatus camptorhynchus]|uniref:uncharacterized protein LOC135710233 n=1 Tax=Ochlerotatus camptorhynchus TaxID=644619 RepID=UPI0031D335DB